VNENRVLVCDRCWSLVSEDYDHKCARHVPSKRNPATLDASSAEIQRLREALAPFADGYCDTEHVGAGKAARDSNGVRAASCGECNVCRARAALAPAGGGGGT
jgi:hypothetical protein